jgi:fluoroquinolone resistance protein
MLGLHFDDCNPFLLSFDFSSCILNFSSFYRLKLKNIRFEDCKLEEAEFVETDLTGAIFKNCDLRGAVFEGAILEHADLRTAFHFSIDPEKTRIKRAKFSVQNVGGLLGKYNIFIEPG